ncbi:MAG TPA: glycosyltransferase family 2 protein [Verrucomicrobiae bacterium]|nr:glycosyltransferase family 2 protein [Verrucomicrobiae bacterium]
MIGTLSRANPSAESGASALAPAHPCLGEGGNRGNGGPSVLASRSPTLEPVTTSARVSPPTTHNPRFLAADCAAVIPCFNEAKTIADVVRSLRRKVSAIFVIDDGSTDDTAIEASREGAVVLRHASNRGKGAALRTGWGCARQDGFHWALTIDGDAQHSVRDLPRFFDAAIATGAALVVGNRMHAAAAMPPLRRAVNRIMSWKLSKAAGKHLPDSQCGFRLLNLHHWAALDLHTEHFEIESELLLRLVRAGLRVEFVPIQVIYKGEQSKIHPFRDTVRWLRWWMRATKRKNESCEPVSPDPERGLKQTSCLRIPASGL